MHFAGIFLLCVAARVLAGRRPAGDDGAFSVPWDLQAFSWDAVEHVFAFGDSYTFFQGTAGHANYSFIGDYLNLSFTPQTLLLNEILARNTSSEGSDWVEFLTGCFEGSPLNCERQLWDFAFAGADIDGALLPLHHDFSTPLVDQVKQWVTYASNVLDHSLGKTLTLWWIGINDTGDTLFSSSIPDFKAFWETEMTSYFNIVQLAYDNGLRDHLFLNVPPGERSPINLGNETRVAESRKNINLANEVLQEHIHNFASTHQDAAILMFDAYSWFNTVLDNPSKFGFENVTGFCTCTDPGFFWYDEGHPTELVHQLLAADIETYLRDAPTK